MEKSKVVIVSLNSNRGSRQRDTGLIREMYVRGLTSLSGQAQLDDALRFFFKDRDRIGIKVNTIGGRAISTAPATSLPLANLLVASGWNANTVLIWDRTNRELKEAGYSLNMNQTGIKVYGTDTNGVGYNRTLTAYLNIGSLFSSIFTNTITASISMAVLKDHGLAGVTGGMKNYFGTIHNPNKYHDNNCDPFVAELIGTPLIRNKHRISILDALKVQYHRGPSSHPQWAENYGALVFSEDAVAADTVGWQIIKKLRAKKGLPSLEEEQRPPRYLYTAEKMGLGTSNLKKIRIIEIEV
ncbi:MAG: DUF362 domain-containing protein [Candidatus Aminicenantes bacterium]|jgi:uncharacterized protein (DUF362 family)